MTKKDYGEFVIYAIIDPTSNRVFYVGRTNNLEYRIKRHFKEAELFDPDNLNDEKYMKLLGLNRWDNTERHPNVEKAKWIKLIFGAGLEPVVKVLDSWYAESLSDANRLEEAWIAHMKMMGEPLTNKVTSRRMQVWWYGENSPRWKPGMARTPLEFIEMLKNGSVKKKSENNTHQKRLNRYKKRYNKAVKRKSK